MGFKAVQLDQSSVLRHLGGRTPPSGSTFAGDGTPGDSSMSANDQESKIDLGLQINFIEWANSQTDNKD